MGGMERFEMNFILKINGEIVEENYCKKHNEWFQPDNEMNCCAMEIEEILQREEVK